MECDINKDEREIRWRVRKRVWARKVCREAIEESLEDAKNTPVGFWLTTMIPCGDSRRAFTGLTPSFSFSRGFYPSFVRRTPFRRLSFIITRVIIEAIIIGIYHAPQRKEGKAFSSLFLTGFRPRAIFTSVWPISKPSRGCLIRRC